MKFYFDACCVNRLTDDHSQTRIRQEAEAIEKLIGFATDNPNTWVGSVVLEAEIARNPDSDRRDDAQAILSFVSQTVKLNESIVRRSRELQDAGFTEFDAMHLASAESAGVHVFLTTDDRLLRRANRKSGRLAVRVSNPVSFLQELRHAGGTND